MHRTWWVPVISGFIVLLVIAGTCMYAPYGPFFAIIPEIMPGNVMAGAIALINSFGALGSLQERILLVLKRNNWSFRSSYIFMAGSLVISAILTLLAVKDRPVMKKDELSEAVV